MNKLFLILLFATCFIKPVCLQENANSGYVLKIKKGKTKKEDSRTFREIPVTLKNTTKDTLYYTTMTCSWQDYYSVDTNNLEVQTVDCDKNIESLLNLPPSKSATVLLRLLIKNPSDRNPVNFKVGFNLKKVNNKQDWMKNRKERRHLKNIIWSNQITMKI